MTRTVRYHPDFSGDVTAAADWYDERQIGLGGAFVESVRVAVENILATPERPSTVDYGLRYWRIRRFPYVVLYDVTNVEVLVVGVMHTAQDAAKWLKRRG